MALIIIPSFVPAQTHDGTGARCTNVVRNLYLGMNDAETGAEVSALQRFLTETGDFTYGEITGYFGPATEGAVQRFQCREMQLCSGGAETNGWGIIGPRTRSAMGARCTIAGDQAADVQAATQPAVVDGCPVAPTAPSTACYGTWKRIDNERSCHVGWQCIPGGPDYEGTLNTGDAPIIHSIDGPTTVKVNENAIWSVYATDPNGDILTYNVNWGDGSYQWPVNLMNASAVYVLTNSFRHVFQTTGLHLIEVRVCDSSDDNCRSATGGHAPNKATAYLLVRVVNDLSAGGEGQMRDDGHPVACPADTMRCLDGTYVSRQGPSCSFALCPATTEAEVKESLACTQDAKQCSDGTWVGRSGPTCEFKCAAH